MQSNECFNVNYYILNLLGMVSSAIANPTDVLKVRMQVASANPTSSSVSLFAAFRKIYKFEGVAGLWRVCVYQLKA